MPDYKKFISIGKIVKPVGISGNLKIIPFTDFPARFKSLKDFFLFDEVRKEFLLNRQSDDYKFKVTDSKLNAKYINLRIEGYDGIDESSELVNLVLMIEEKERIKLEEGNFYYYELIGMEVFDKDELIGEVISIENYGSGDLFKIKFAGKEIFVPFRKEFIKKIDVDNKRIDAELIEGFL